MQIMMAGWMQALLPSLGWILLEAGHSMEVLFFLPLFVLPLNNYLFVLPLNNYLSFLLCARNSSRHQGYKLQEFVLLSLQELMF